MKEMINYYVKEYGMSEKTARDFLLKSGYQHNFDYDEETWLGREE